LKAVFTLVHILDGLDGETEGHFVRTVEKLEHMVADPAAKLTSLAWPRRQFYPTIAGATLVTDDIGSSHGPEPNTMISVFLRTPIWRQVALTVPCEGAIATLASSSSRASL
jgi:hypothetical protein